ncbi:SOS response-associated peptidase [Schaalia hyovaginalis]|uniref:SOS response-associated peptidase n=1 Tax=Schaalia hyovaginalis TaxID=29316 RepID=UPI0026F04042|nr:SOS response-associated peptidase [Schaalia hyovaginalis]MCI6557820.1 SOS response-associated peptidase [Schaalia hyovaginalis]
MCGRFSIFVEDDELVSFFDIDLLEAESAGPRYNLAPGQSARVVYERLLADPPAPASSKSSPSSVEGIPIPSGEPAAPPSSPDPAAREGVAIRKARPLRWGFVPSWAKDPSRPMINARAETVTEKPSFRAAALRRRCLVPANGYFEWQAGAAGKKQPWFLSAGEGDPLMAFAGIYEAWRDPAPPADPDRGDGAWLLTFAILTRPAPDALGTIHDRSPLVVPRDMFSDWLDPVLSDRAEVRRLIEAIPVPDLAPRRVSPGVGNVRNDDPALIEGVRT